MTGLTMHRLLHIYSLLTQWFWFAVNYHLLLLLWFRFVNRRQMGTYWLCDRRCLPLLFANKIDVRIQNLGWFKTYVNPNDSPKQREEKQNNNKKYAFLFESIARACWLLRINRNSCNWQPKRYKVTPLTPWREMCFVYIFTVKDIFYRHFDNKINNNRPRYCQIWHWLWLSTCQCFAVYILLEPSRIGTKQIRFVKLMSQFQCEE